ncbi:hypothetical protein [Fulvivirga sediminis]|uniref:Uncharacterized protein n=1 Tax=Fulvivirga sediminis TaxID=2803949 RepID=A0A937F3R5_9BACT|nr:hypothetical protein [Fulvivirga sediminis]MBL3655160.1 hypothetical protein [Fulvivirga sediminis]
MRKILIIIGCVITFLIVLVMSNPAIVFGLAPWKSQKIIYRHRLDQQHRIEFQMQDVGALGYNRRIVEIKPFLFFHLTEEIDTSNIDKNEWLQVDEEINEIEFKGA